MDAYLGIDIGGTTAKWGVVAEDGKLLRKGSFPTGALCDEEGLLSSIQNIAETNFPENLKGIGISTLGTVDSKAGKVLGAAYNLNALTGLDLKGILESRCQMPVLVVNDANAAALCEHWLGAAKDCGSFYIITFGTGLGGSFFLQGKVCEGAHFQAGEICYPDYESDDVCLEKEISTLSVMEQAAEALGLSHLDGIEFFRRVEEKDAVAVGILDGWLTKAAKLIANIIVMLDPEKILIGGAISAQKRLIIPQLRKKANRFLPVDFRDKVMIEAARCGNDAGILGAVSGFVLSRSARAGSNADGEDGFRI